MTLCEKRRAPEIIELSDDEDYNFKSPTERIRQPFVFDEVRLTLPLRLDVNGSGGNPMASASKRPRRPFVNSTHLFLEAALVHGERHAVALETSVPRSQADIDSDHRYRSIVSSGDEILARMKLALESFGMTRTFLQVTMHDLAMNVMGSAIYGEEWNQHRARILDANNWRDYPPLMAAICARRFGKSFGAGLLAAASMLSIPSCAVGCFAPTLRQATAIMQTCWSLLTKSSMFSSFKIVRTRATEIVVKGIDGTERSLIAYPSTHKVSWNVCVFILARSSKKASGTSLCKSIQL